MADGTPIRAEITENESGLGDSDTHDSDTHGEFVELLSTHNHRVYTFIRTLTLNHQSDAEEIYQNVCMIAWDKFEQYEDSGNFGAWICKIAYYEVLKLRTSRNRIRFLSESALRSLADASLPIAKNLNERRETLADCIQKLNTDDRKLVEARYSNSQTPKEIASLTGRSVKSIYRSLSRVHGLLQRCVQASIRFDEA